MKCDVCGKSKPKRDMQLVQVNRYLPGPTKTQDFNTEKEIIVCDTCVININFADFFYITRMEELERVLNADIRNDKTPEYPYAGKTKGAKYWKNNLGQPPPKGERWLTPRELARNALKM